MVWGGVGGGMGVVVGLGGGAWRDEVSLARSCRVWRCRQRDTPVVTLCHFGTVWRGGASALTQGDSQRRTWPAWERRAPPPDEPALARGPHSEGAWRPPPRAPPPPLPPPPP